MNKCCSKSIRSVFICVCYMYIQDSFLECTYLFDEDGTQVREKITKEIFIKRISLSLLLFKMYCCICAGGEEVFMCDAENCAK